MNTEDKLMEVLALRCGEEEYGVDIQKVQEIRGHDPVTRIANVPGFIEGVVNLRGIIAIIVDLRLRFGRAAAKVQTTDVVRLGRAGFLLALGTIDERMLILLDIEAPMSSSEPGLIDRLVA